MDKNTLIKVTNRDTGNVGYAIPELGVRRQFVSRETKEIPFSELMALSYLPGGHKMLTDYLVVHDEEAISQLLNGVEPEYYYTEEDVKRIMQYGSLDEFLDCLDFAPDGVLDMIKDLSVTMPLNDVAKRDAILEKLSFNVSKAIEIQNMKFDGEDDAEKTEVKQRRVAPKIETSAGRRTELPKYKVSSIAE